MKADEYRAKLERDVRDNYLILKQLLTKEQFNALSYHHLIFIILDANVPIHAISYFQNTQYGDQAPELNDQMVVQDALTLKKEIVNKAWRFDKSFDRGKTVDVNIRNNALNSQKKSQSNLGNLEQQSILQNIYSTVEIRNELANKKHPRKLEGFKSRKMAILQIEEQMSRLQGKLNTTKNEEEAAQYQKQYNKLFKYLTKLRNQQRLEHVPPKKTNPNPNTTQIPGHISEILQKIGQIKKQRSKILDKQPKYQEIISKSQQIFRLNSIFTYYSKKQIQSNRYFSDFQKDHGKLKIQMFMRFVQEWRIHRIVSIQQIANLFKLESKGTRSITALQFTQLLSDIHNLQCIQEDKPITSESLSQYFQEYIVSNAKINKIVLNSSSDKKEGSSEYKFKPKSHSGKHIKDIKDELEERKKTLDFLAGPKNTPQFNLISKSKSRVITTGNSREQSESRTLKFYNASSLNDSVNSYAFRFKLKNIKNRIKTDAMQKSHLLVFNSMNQKETESSLEQSQLNPGTQRDSTINQKAGNPEDDMEQHTLLTKDKSKKKELEGIENLIQESEEDQYLNSHLFPPIKQNRLISRIHY